MKILSFLLFIFSFNLMASHLPVEEDIIQYAEKFYHEDIKNLSEEEKIKRTKSFADELFANSFYDKAKTYYEIVVNSKFENDKADSYLRLINIDAILETDDLEKKISEANKYFKKHPELKTEEIEAFLNLTNTTPRQIPFKILIKTKKYDEAFKRLSSDKLETKNIMQKVEYDLLNVLLNKKVKKLYCEDEMKRFPDSILYPIILCDVLSDYIKNKKIDKKKMKALQDAFEINNYNAFLLDAVKDLK